MSLFSRFKQFIYQQEAQIFQPIEENILNPEDMTVDRSFTEGLACPIDQQKRPKLAIALGGGATKGFAHIGVLRLLDHMGIIPDMVIGTSAGSLVGSLYAAGMSSQQLARIALQLDESDIRDFTLSRQGLVKGEKLQNLVNSFVQNRSIEQFAIPFAAVATDPSTGNTVVLDHGNAGLAVRASCSIPGIFVPVEIEGRLLVDGGVSCPVPVSVAQQMGANIVIAVDISGKPEVEKTEGLFGVLGQSISIMNYQIIQTELNRADFVIQPDVQGIRLTDMRAKAHLIRQGFIAAHSHSHALREMLESHHWFEDVQTIETIPHETVRQIGQQIEDLRHKPQ